MVVAWFGGPRRNVFAATAFTVASGLHLTLASIGWWERYQAYLIGLGVYVALAIAAEVLPGTRRKVVPALVVVALLVSPVKFEIFSQTPLAADNMYRDHVQPARFLDRYYDGEPIATGELGYISLAHDGPLTDLIGLGDYEVLQARLDQRDGDRYWADLARRRGFGVVAVYPVTLLFDTPEEWILIGSFRLNEKRATSVSKEFQFWATTPDAGERLIADLRDFEPDLPEEIELDLNELGPAAASPSCAAPDRGQPGGAAKGWGMQSSSSSATTIRSRFSKVTSLRGSRCTLYSRKVCSRLS